MGVPPVNSSTSCGLRQIQLLSITWQFIMLTMSGATTCGRTHFGQISEPEFETQDLMRDFNKLNMRATWCESNILGPANRQDHHGIAIANKAPTEERSRRLSEAVDCLLSYTSLYLVGAENDKWIKRSEILLTMT